MSDLLPVQEPEPTEAQRLPFDARDRIERTLRGCGHDPSTAGLVAHRIMLALIQEVSS